MQSVFRIDQLTRDEKYRNCRKLLVENIQGYAFGEHEKVLAEYLKLTTEDFEDIDQKPEYYSGEYCVMEKYKLMNGRYSFKARYFALVKPKAHLMSDEELIEKIKAETAEVIERERLEKEAEAKKQALAEAVEAELKANAEPEAVNGNPTMERFMEQVIKRAEEVKTNWDYHEVQAELLEMGQILKAAWYLNEESKENVPV